MTLELYAKMQEDLSTRTRPKYKPVWLRDVFLQSIYRRHIIHAVKEPLLNAIVLAAKLLPLKPERSNCRFIFTFGMMEIWDEFFENYKCRSRTKFFRAIRDLFLAEIEHDEHYKLMFEWFIKKVVERVNDGRLVLRKEDLTPEEWQAIYVQKGSR